MLEEIWKDIPDYEGLYQVSNLGRIKSLYFGKERILKPQPNSMGYLRVGLSKNGNWIHFFVHRLVASVFLKNDNNLPCVNHKDENPLNNHVDNLEFCNHTYNMNYGTIIERKRKSMKGKFDGENNPFYKQKHTEKSKQKMSKAKAKPILQYTLDNIFIREWDSAKQAENELGCYGIGYCCKGKRKSSGGFIWKYKDVA